MKSKLRLTERGGIAENILFFLVFAGVVGTMIGLGFQTLDANKKVKCLAERVYRLEQKVNNPKIKVAPYSCPKTLLDILGNSL
jgi:hypothetical protein